MANKLWGGRFDKQPSQEMLEFLSKEDSQLDEKLAAYDIKGSIAHVTMLSKQKIISKKEAGEIIKALFKLYAQAKAGNFHLDHRLEDVHTNVEAAVTKATAAGKKMHIARSRNDQLCLDAKMYMRDAINQLSHSLLSLQASLAKLAKKDCIFPSYTHFQVAQPASLLLWSHAHWQEFERALQRLSELYERVNKNPLGSGAVAGTGWNIDKQYTSKLLGFSSPTENPMDSVSNRGELETELLGILTIALTHASRIAEDIILYSNKGLIILPDQYSTGSSMMPQKKNPDVCELIRGKASRMLGLYVMCAGISKSLATGFNRDTQETKYALINGVETALATFSILSKMLPNLEFDKKKIEQELESGFSSTTELADLLSKKGVAFREAHKITGKLVKGCIAKEKYLSSLSAAQVSSAAGIKIPQKELKEAVSVNKVKRFSGKCKISQSKHAKLVSEREKALSAANKLLEKQAKSITSQV